ncbi:MAG TPA: response regulator [Caulobacteraceae bacterium]|nr:response regulator [Caulobacteraceae bacterium]
MRALLVEDEVLIALLIEDMLRELGHEVVVTATGLAEAIDYAGRIAVDFAVLDVNLHGQNSAPVAERLKARGIPFVFATGYGRDGIEPAFRDRMVLTKPFARLDLAAAIERQFQ